VHIIFNILCWPKCTKK